MVQEGVAVGDFEKAYNDLLSINARSAKSRDALAQFVSKVGGPPELVDQLLDVMRRPLPAGFSISTTPNAKEILKYFAKTHTLALVTGGHPPFQLEKLEKAGIDRTIFSKIAIPEDSIKKPFYRGLIEEFSVSPNQALVCGDRIAMDLAPAFELGFTTVHMRWGRGTLVETEKWIHHAISDLNELKRIIKT
jgi:FMN phosphatase YigB (HAD superfamily)